MTKIEQVSKAAVDLAQECIADRRREKNNNWKGGRLIGSNGYVLIRVDPSHPLRDIRGYAYEHRLVASQKIGRWLEPGEQVHHVNGNKTDNRPENLEILTCAEHGLKHRKKGSIRQLPGEDNALVQCACGCGETFAKFDRDGRPRRYVSGHNSEKISTKEILDFIGDRAVTIKEISSSLGWSISTINRVMLNLQREQKITRFRRDKYCQLSYAYIYLSNPLVYCACGCGEQFSQYDKYGRIRKYKLRHGFVNKNRVVS